MNELRGWVLTLLDWSGLHFVWQTIFKLKDLERRFIRFQNVEFLWLPITWALWVAHHAVSIQFSRQLLMKSCRTTSSYKKLHQLLPRTAQTRYTAHSSLSQCDFTSWEPAPATVFHLLCTAPHISFMAFLIP